MNKRAVFSVMGVLGFLVLGIDAKPFEPRIKPNGADLIQWVTPDEEARGAYRVLDITGAQDKEKIDLFFRDSKAGVKSQVVFLDRHEGQVHGYLILKKGNQSEVFRVFAHSTNPKVVYRCKMLNRDNGSIVFEQVDYFDGVELSTDPHGFLGKLSERKDGGKHVKVECR